MLREKHLNVFNITTTCTMTALLIACLVSNRWLVNDRLQTFEGIWRGCQEISFGHGAVCAPFSARTDLEGAMRVLMVLASLTSSICIGLTVLTMNVKYISPGHVYASSFLTFLFVVVALPIKTYELLHFMEQSKDTNYTFGWSFYVGVTGSVIAVVFPVVGIFLMRKLHEPEYTSNEQSDDLIFERF